MRKTAHISVAARNIIYKGFSKGEQKEKEKKVSATAHKALEEGYATFKGEIVF